PAGGTYLCCLQSWQYRLDQVERADWAGADKRFAGGKTGGGPREHGRAANAVENMGLAGRKLRLIAADGGQLLLQRVADIDREVARIAAGDFGLESEAKIKLGLDRVDGQIIEMLVPLGQAGIKDRGVGNLHRLPMIG